MTLELGTDNTSFAQIAEAASNVARFGVVAMDPKEIRAEVSANLKVSRDHTGDPAVQINRAPIQAQTFSAA